MNTTTNFKFIAAFVFSLSFGMLNAQSEEGFAIMTKSDLLSTLSTLQAKDGSEKILGLELPDKGKVEVKLNLIDDEIATGPIQNEGYNSFALYFNEGEITGHAIYYDDRMGYTFEMDDNDVLRATKKDIDDLVCSDYMIDRQGPPIDSAMVSKAQPSLQSRPGARACIYLDFDGEFVSGSSWNNGVPIDAQSFGYSNTQITQCYEYIAQDFINFDVNVTTDRAVFDSYPSTRSVMVIFTTTNWRGSGGVAYIGSFSRNDEPCWTFNRGLQSAATTGSHEAGHTLFLRHDGRNNPSEVYYSGHQEWGPIMGGAFGRDVDQWSKGEYNSANNLEDDLSIITTQNGFGYIGDDHADAIAGATAIQVSAAGNLTSQQGLIETSGDVDVFEIEAGAGPADITVTPNSNRTNLNAEITILNSSGVEVASSSTPGMGARVTTNLNEGVYYLVIDGVGFADPLFTGYTDYGSLGNYTITGSVAPSNFDCNGVENGTAFFDDCQNCVGGTTGEFPCLTPEVAANGSATFCDGESLTLSVDPSSVPVGGLNYQWSLDGNTLNGETSSSIVVEEGGAYTVFVSDGQSEGTSESFTVTTIAAPDAPTVAETSICGPGEVTLTAVGTGTGVITWYDNGNVVETGATFTTTVQANKTFGIKENLVALSGSIGLEDNTSLAGGTHGGDQFLVFDALSDIIIESATVYADGAGERTFLLQDAQENVLEELVVNLPNGESRLTLDFEVPEGNGYRLGAASGASLYRTNDATTPYPFILENVMRINESTAGTATQFYYYYYDIAVSQNAPSCDGTEGDAVVTVIDVPDAPAVDDQTACQPGGDVTFTATANGNGDVVWYDMQNTAIAQGSVLDTFITSSITLQVREEIGTSETVFTTPEDNTLGGGGIHGGNQYIIFDALQDIRIESATVYAEVAKDRTFELLDANGGTIASVTRAIPVGASRVELGFDVPQGVGYQIGAPQGADLFRNNAGVSYPYLTPGVVSMTGSTAGADWYYYLYNWEVTIAGEACTGDMARAEGIVDVCTGVNELTENSLAIFPNPTTDRLEIKGDLNSWTISATDGVQLMNGTSSEIDVTGLKSGQYIIEVAHEGRVFQESFVKQ